MGTKRPRIARTPLVKKVGGKTAKSFYGSQVDKLKEYTLPQTPEPASEVATSDTNNLSTPQLTSVHKKRLAFDKTPSSANKATPKKVQTPKNTKTPSRSVKKSVKKKPLWSEI